MAEVRRGHIIVNTGTGKGKTTTAMGTAPRDAGADARIHERLVALWRARGGRAFGGKFVTKQTSRGFVKAEAQRPDPEDVRMVEKAWIEAEKSIQSGGGV